MSAFVNTRKTRYVRNISGISGDTRNTMNEANRTLIIRSERDDSALFSISWLT